MKPTQIRFFAILLALIFLLCACEEYKPAVDQPHNRPGNTESESESVAGDEAEGYTFTVQLVDETGAAFIPAADAGVKVKWSDGYSVYESTVDATGKASVEGLDGDYTVTVDPVPDGYAYNPNIYSATNDRRDLTVQLHPLIPTEGRGDQRYQSIEITELGVYCVELTSETQEVFFQFSPKVNGEYIAESWVDTTADMVNPIAKYYGANISYKEYRFTQDDGGVEGKYTRNFLLDFAIASENISENGAAAFTFGIMAGQKAGEYPVKVYFSIERKNDYELTHANGTIMIPEEELVQQPDYPGYTFVGAESEETYLGRKVFDGSRFQLWAREDGGDGYYHLYDPTLYADTDGYGPILYAKISQARRFTEQPFTTIEYAGNKALTVSNGDENYKLFIEGFDYLNYETLSLDPANGKAPYFCTLDCPCRENGTCDSVAITGSVGACYDGCEHCTDNCNTLPEGGIGHKGYGEYTNSDGCYAVTAELKDFLLKFSVSQRYFFDGNGWVETHESISVFASDEDQWLFACGYYVPA